MAPPPKIKLKVKKELDLTPPPRQGLGSFKIDPDTIGTSGINGSFTKTAIVPLIPDPDWKRCESDERLKRVRIKEQAVKKGASALKEIAKTLKQHSPAIPACKLRISKIGMSHTCSLPAIQSSLIIWMLTYFTEDILSRKKVGF